MKPYKKIKKYKIFIAYYLRSARLIDNIQVQKKYAPIPKNDKKPITSVIVVTNTLEDIAGSILNFLRETGTSMPNNPAATIFKIIDTAINIDKFNSLNHN